MYRQLINLLIKNNRKKITFDKGYNRKKTLIFHDNKLKLIETTTDKKIHKVLDENDNISELYYEIAILISGK